MSKRYPGGIIRKTPQTPSQTSAQGIWDMASVTQAVKENTWPIAGVPDPVSKSLRFRSSASAYLNRTLGSPTNNKIWTWSAWVKRGVLSTNQGLFACWVGAGSTRMWFGFVTSTNQITFYGQNGGSTIFDLATTPVYRDPSAWYHIVLAVDTTQATASNRAKIYVNGVQVTAFSTSTYASQNTDTAINSANAHYLGSEVTTSTVFDGYMTEVYFVDGQALTPSSFGTTDDQTGVWEPIAYTGTYGTNGFYLPFSNTASTATLGNDFSGNSNNWTTNNISLTSGSTYDSMVDVPTQWIPYNTAGDTGALYRGNYCTLNPISNPNGTIVTYSDGNLAFSHSASSGNATKMTVQGTMALPAGKFYWEYTVGATVNDQVGIGTMLVVGGSADGTAGARYINNGTFQSSYTTPSSAASYTTGDVIGMAYDQPNGTLAFYKNNSLQGTVTNISTSEVFFPLRSPNTSGSGGAGVFNFGQRPFSYTPPSGFLTLNTRNLPTPTIGTTSTTQAGDYFDVVTYTGAGGTQTISGLQFQPDFIWGKARSAAYGSALFDSVRGYGSTKGLVSNLTQAEGTVSAQYGYISTNTSTGFTAAAGNDSSNPNAALNESGVTYVAWNWKANGAGSTNTAGTITSTVSANTSAGFSIVTFTAPASGSFTIGHGLGVAPAMIITKARSTTNFWVSYHQSIGNTGMVALNRTDAVATSSLYWGNTSPTSTVFTIGDASTFSSNATGVAYCFAQIAGYSAFGSYVGNGVADGPFIYTGFRPRYFILKNITSAQSWSVQDTSRSPYNVGSAVLLPNSSSAELTGTDFIDIVSNGFKIRHSSSGNNNNSGDTYIYMAFAENPFKYANAR